MADLIPARFEAHVQRLFSEHAARGSLYDFPVRKIWQPNPRFDTRVRFHGAIAATPVGPAAGPHTQLAQNLVLSWLGGARILELKTVQLNDTLTLPRPCIDAATIGFNVEWSQELRLAAVASGVRAGLDAHPRPRPVRSRWRSHGSGRPLRPLRRVTTWPA
jgi:putative selenate reductase